MSASPLPIPSTGYMTSQAPVHTENTSRLLVNPESAPGNNNVGQGAPKTSGTPPSDAKIVKKSGKIYELQFFKNEGSAKVSFRLPNGLCLFSLYREFSPDFELLQCIQSFSALVVSSPYYVTFDYSATEKGESLCFRNTEDPRGTFCLLFLLSVLQSLPSVARSFSLTSSQTTTTSRLVSSNADELRQSLIHSSQKIDSSTVFPFPTYLLPLILPSRDEVSSFTSESSSTITARKIPKDSYSLPQLSLQFQEMHPLSDLHAKSDTGIPLQQSRKGSFSHERDPTAVQPSPGIETNSCTPDPTNTPSDSPLRNALVLGSAQQSGIQSSPLGDSNRVLSMELPTASLDDLSNSRGNIGEIAGEPSQTSAVVEECIQILTYADVLFLRIRSECEEWVQMHKSLSFTAKSFEVMYKPDGLPVQPTHPSKVHGRPLGSSNSSLLDPLLLSQLLYRFFVRTKRLSELFTALRSFFFFDVSKMATTSNNNPTAPMPMNRSINTYASHEFDTVLKEIRSYLLQAHTILFRDTSQEVVSYKPFRIPMLFSEHFLQPSQSAGQTVTPAQSAIKSTTCPDSNHSPLDKLYLSLREIESIELCAYQPVQRIRSKLVTHQDISLPAGRNVFLTSPSASMSSQPCGDMSSNPPHPESLKQILAIPYRKRPLPRLKKAKPLNLTAETTIRLRSIAYYILTCRDNDVDDQRARWDAVEDEEELHSSERMKRRRAMDVNAHPMISPRSQVLSPLPHGKFPWHYSGPTSTALGSPNNYPIYHQNPDYVSNAPIRVTPQYIGGHAKPHTPFGPNSLPQSSSGAGKRCKFPLVEDLGSWVPSKHSNTPSSTAMSHDPFFTALEQAVSELSNSNETTTEYGSHVAPYRDLQAQNVVRKCVYSHTKNGLVPTSIELHSLETASPVDAHVSINSLPTAYLDANPMFREEGDGGASELAFQYYLQFRTNFSHHRGYSPRNKRVNVAIPDCTQSLGSSYGAYSSTASFSGSPSILTQSFGCATPASSPLQAPACMCNSDRHAAKNDDPLVEIEKREVLCSYCAQKFPDFDTPLGITFTRTLPKRKRGRPRKNQPIIAQSIPSFRCPVTLTKFSVTQTGNIDYPSKLGHIATETLWLFPNYDDPRAAEELGGDHRAPEGQDTGDERYEGETEDDFGSEPSMPLRRADYLKPCTVTKDSDVVSDATKSIETAVLPPCSGIKSPGFQPQWAQRGSLAKTYVSEAVAQSPSRKPGHGFPLVEAQTIGGKLVQNGIPQSKFPVVPTPGTKRGFHVHQMNSIELAFEGSVQDKERGNVYWGRRWVTEQESVCGVQERIIKGEYGITNKRKRRGLQKKLWQVYQDEIDGYAAQVLPALLHAVFAAQKNLPTRTSDLSNPAMRGLPQQAELLRRLNPQILHDVLAIFYLICRKAQLQALLGQWPENAFFFGIPCIKLLQTIPTPALDLIISESEQNQARNSEDPSPSKKAERKGSKPSLKEVKIQLHPSWLQPIPPSTNSPVHTVAGNPSTGSYESSFLYSLAAKCEIVVQNTISKHVDAQINDIGTFFLQFSETVSYIRSMIEVNTVPDLKLELDISEFVEALCEDSQDHITKMNEWITNVQQSAQIPVPIPLWLASALRNVLTIDNAVCAQLTSPISQTAVAKTTKSENVQIRNMPLPNLYSTVLIILSVVSPSLRVELPMLATKKNRCAQS